MEAGNFEEPLDPFARIQQCQMTVLVPDRCPDRDELSQAGTVDVVYAGEIQNKTLLAIAQKVIHQIAQWQVKDPQAAREIQDCNIGNSALFDGQSHELIWSDSIPFVNNSLQRLAMAATAASVAASP